MNVREIIKQLDGVEEGGINWSWVKFPCYKNAQLFIDYLNENNIEHRGIYIEPYESASVRWR